MVFSKQYLRYTPESIFGLVGTNNSICFVTKYSDIGRLVAVSACENVILWDLRKNSKVLTLSIEDHRATVSSLEVRPPTAGTLDNANIAVGYSDGTLAVFETNVNLHVRYNGHRVGIKTIAWDKEGMRVASGSSDGEIVVWDVVTERGIVRLRGHKGQITKVCFMDSRNVLVSSCKDSHIKFWDLDTNHCFRTLSAHRAEVWDFVLLRNDTRLVTGSADAELRVWGLRFKDPLEEIKALKIGSSDEVIEEPDEKRIFLDKSGDIDITDDSDKTEDDASPLEIEKMGSILRSRGDRVCGLVSDGRTVACFGKSQVVDLYVILTEEETMEKLSKRLKKARKRASKTGLPLPENEDSKQLSDELRRLPSFKTLVKLSGLHLCTSRDGSIKLAVLLTDNSIVTYGTHVDAKTRPEEADPDCIVQNHLTLPGHRGDIRAVSFNSISDQVVTAGADAIKVWSRETCQPLLTVPSDYALSLIVPPGDRHALIGTKAGNLQLYDLGSGALLENLKAHDSNEDDLETGVWTLALKHDGRGFLSGGSDCFVKFWTFELVQDTDAGRGKRLSFSQDSKALKVADQVSSVRCSSDGILIAVATLDLKETIYYFDTLKLFHELYGKSMPSTCVDFSSDATLLVTGCKDASIRLYGTSFGDQIKLLKGAHPGGVTDIRFIATTHLFFSCGTDSTVKQWDADNFQRIITINSHKGIIRCLSVCAKGKFLVTCSHDNSIRLHRQSQEFLILEEEREEERRKKEDVEGLGAVQRPVVVGEDEKSSAVRPTRTTAETEKAADLLLEGLAIYREQREAGEKAEPHQLMKFVYQTNDPLRFLLLVLRKIKSSELEEAILILPLNKVLDLLIATKSILEKDWDVELAARVTVVALRVNLPQLIASPSSVTVLKPLSQILLSKTAGLQDKLGFNLAGLRHIKDRLDERSESQLFVEAAGKQRDVRKKMKRKERLAKRAILTL